MSKSGGRRSGKKILVADLLCGAGGSSTGCQRALHDLGLEMELVCVNHWPIAIATHQRNHPEARHYVQDISTVRPHLLVPEGYLDLLMASPTCTHHSVARGGKPTSDQQRSDPWHIITWLTELRVKRLIIENVWEFTGWGPVDHRTGRPVASRKGEYFRAWIDTIRRLGFSPEWRKLNAADYGDATTRQRFILMARSDRKRLTWPVATHCRRGDRAGDLFSGSRPWRPAREIIDWTLKGRSIFGRKKALAPKTLARIYAGARKHRWPEPFLVVLRNHMAAQGIDLPLPTIAAGGSHIGLAEPVLLANRTNNVARDPSVSPLPCLTTAHGGGIMLAEPIILSQHTSGAPRGADDPLPTITTGGAAAKERQGCARPILIEAFLLSRHGDGYGSSRAHAIDEPTPTANCDGGGYLVEPFVLSAAHGVDAEETDPHSRRVKSVDDPLGTVHAGGGNFGIVEPFILSRHAGGAPRSVEDPTPTQVAKHSQVLISPYYGSGSGESCASADEPLPTVTAKGRFGMVVPITHAGGGNRARDVDADPIPTVTTANRGELAFIAAQFGEREGQGPRVHDVDDPTPTICASGRVNLVQGTLHYDILFRMLEPHELAAAMGFNTDDDTYEFTGTKTEQIKQIGNAVSVAKMKACVGAIMADEVRPARTGTVVP